MGASWRVGIDTGGTFTDLAAVELFSGRLYIDKVPSTPEDPARSVLHALERFWAATSATPESVVYFAHGSTVATNALLEGQGAKVGLVVTRGFRAVYPLRAQERPRGRDLIDPRYRKPEPLVPQSLTEEVEERVRADGTIARPLDLASVRRAILRLREQGVESLAVALLFSFRNPAHEEAIEAVARELAPELRVSLSSRVLPVIREYPRLSTTVLDAYVGPVMARYLQRLSASLRQGGIRTGQRYLMQSNGGLMRLEVASQHPNETLLSGPAAGVVFGRDLGERAGLENVVTFDMGGTSTDISVLPGLRIQVTQSGQIAGQDIATPMLEIHTLGAGGGTVAFVGPDGLLKVGPRSAGAYPGPASYGRGGEEPTVTDANVVLGLLDPARFVGIEAEESRRGARAAIGRLARSLGLSLDAAAVGIRRIVNVKMAVGVRAALAEKGADPRRFTLVAFGGAGPLHACAVARQAGMPEVLIPARPGVACALGLLRTDVLHTYVQALPLRFSQLTPQVLLEAVERLRGRGQREAQEEGFAPEVQQWRWFLDMRYRRQGYQLAVPFDPGEELFELRARFDELHRAVYGIAAADSEVEAVQVWGTLQVSVGWRGQWAEHPAGRGAGRTRGHRSVLLENGQAVSVPVWERAALQVGDELVGPCLIEQEDATTFLEPGDVAVVDQAGNLRVRLGADGGRS
ncbi:MAG: hydantoinase/oxoprolinase family protein [Firmicutes bacterium]|nr:hydantoinase/oxoprolinase family protein [Bacillota bacterium]